MLKRGRPWEERLKRIRLALISLIACAALAASATDKTDLWWNPNESGWGMNIADQGGTMFITMFVFGTDGQPTWYVGTVLFQFTDSLGVNVYTGSWYRVTGPYYGVSFNPSLVNASQVGTVTYRATNVNEGQITYNVGATTVTKNVQRQPLQNNPYIYGSFRGAITSTTSGCANFHNAAESFGLAITGSPSQTTMTFTLSGNTCTVSGPYIQAGRMGLVNGTLTCTGGSVAGSELVFEIEASNFVVTGRFVSNYTGSIGACSD